jgi:hypothetical protein
MSTDDSLEDIHIRILRVTEDLRAIQRELNCAVMEAPGNPELMETLTQLPEIESLDVLKSALDQMRHFLWFYMQVMSNECEASEALCQTLPAKSVSGPAAKSNPLPGKFQQAAEIAMLQFLSDGKARKPN